FVQSLKRGAAAIGIEIDEDVVEDNRQRIDMIRVLTDESQAHSEVQLLGCSTAEGLRRQAHTIGTLDLDVSSVEWSDYADIPGLGHDIKKRRRLTEHFRLPFGLVNLPSFVKQRAAQGDDRPLFCGFIDSGQDGLLP